MDTNSIHTILAPAIHATCHLTPEATHIFPPHPPYSTTARTGDIRLRPLPVSPATPAKEAPRVPSTPPRATPQYPPNREQSPLHPHPIRIHLHIMTWDTPPLSHCHNQRDCIPLRGAYPLSTFTTRTTTGPPPLDTEIYSRKLGIHGRLQNCRAPKTGRLGCPYTNSHHHLY